MDILGRAPSFLFLHPQFLVSSSKGASCKVSYWHETSPTLPPCPGENRKGVRWLLQNHCTLRPLLKAGDLLRGSETPCECRRVTIASAVFLRDCWLEDVWGWVSGGGRCEGQVFCGWFLSPASDKEEDTSVLYTEQETERLSSVSGFGLWGGWHLSLPGVEGLWLGRRGCPPWAPSSQLQGLKST